ncbi:competence/damage-inducible protein A [Flavobacteriaceae bacterium MHTCC 0001]
MLAEIITIGDELLIGQVVDTNSAFIAKNLNDIGASVYQITSIQDDKAHILQALKDAESRVDIIILTGGLGPTKDDITKKTIAEYFDDTLIRDNAVTKNIEDIWKKYVRQTLLQINKDQALVPSKATVLMNKLGTAPGMWLEKEEKTFVSLPGVPFEMKKLLVNEVIPKLKKRYQFPSIQHKTILTYGLGESTLAKRIEAWEEALPKTVKLAYLPKLGSVRLRLSSKGDDENNVRNSIETEVQKLLPLIEDAFVGFEDEAKSLEVLVAKRLSKLGKTLAIAESCTGGDLAEQFTKNAGASAFFNGGVVTYATDSKVKVLGVPKALIDSYSVVSKEVVETMAKNVRELFNSDYGIATTGNAGPSKGDSDVDIGTVFIAIASKEGVVSESFMLGSARKRVIKKAVNKALEMLEKELLKHK